MGEGVRGECAVVLCSLLTVGGSGSGSESNAQTHSCGEGGGRGRGGEGGLVGCVQEVVQK